MTDYNELTDLEINERVAKYLFPNDTVEIIEDQVVVFSPFKNESVDYCNTWHEGGPVIEKYGISLSYDNGEWEAKIDIKSGFNSAWGIEIDSVSYIDDLPLRAAMITLLIMKDITHEQKELEKTNCGRDGSND